MYLSGIADEAGADLETQIRAHQELGWKHIELRLIGGVCVTDLDAAAFDNVASCLDEAGLQVSCFASQVANWARPIDSDFSVDLAELEQAIPRMQRLGTRWIRCMSYPNADPPLAEADWHRSVVERMKQLAEIAAQGDVVLVHENCHGWASENAEQALQLLAEVDSPHLRLVFDTGNPICFGQDSWKLYQSLRDHIAYVHIKDYGANKETVQKEEDVTATFPGEGNCSVREIVRDLLSTGYDGGFSIEPHITSVIHLDHQASDPELAYRTYVEYGRKLEALIADVRP